MSQTDEFVSVNDFVPTWNPRSTGSKKNGDRKDLTPTEKSFIIGWYLGSREAVIENKKYIIHKILLNGVGDQAHLSEPLPEGEQKIYEFFGTTVVTKQLAENVQPGQYVRIKWLGKVQAKTEGVDPYHNWDVGVSTKTEPIAVQNGIPVEYSGNSAQTVESEAKQDSGAEQAEEPGLDRPNAGGAVNEDTGTGAVAADDDLPF